MTRRILIVLAVLVFGVLAYQRASLYVKTSYCEKNPTSDCLAELAISYLPAYTRFGGYDHLGDKLRDLGYGNVVDAKMKQREFAYAADDRSAKELVDLLIDDTDAFEALTPHSEPFVYSKAFHRLTDDFRDFGGGFYPDVIRAEKAALARRGPPGLHHLTRPLLNQWRNALEVHATRSFDWRLYASRARELGAEEEAKSALSKAIELGISDLDEWPVIYETWQLYGVEAALTAIAEIPATNARANHYLNISNRLLEHGDTASAATAYQEFLDSYDEDAPVRLATAHRSMARSASIVSYGLGHTDQALVWANKYEKGWPFMDQSTKALEAAELFARLDAGDTAAQMAYRGIELAPAPGETARGPWLSVVSTTPYYYERVGRAIGVLCRVGRYTDAFALTEDNPEIGRRAVSGCDTALDREKPAMTLEALADSLSLRSPRQLELIRAAALVETGSYEAARAHIEDAINSPSALEDGFLAAENLPYLRLAVAMRDETLGRKIMAAIARQALWADRKEAAGVLATAASYTHSWPDGVMAD